ncbi:hypothetical protein [Streptomyces sp. CA-111067]|uniref:hypothetical protein n=1 Tax=Streptomyces sp. CA-111067 TaxID=3240046 RepID=UPI003D99FB01
MGDPTTQKVANPHLAALRQLRSDLAAATETFRAALKTTAADMGGQKVWTGRAAFGWEQTVNHQRSRVTSLVDKLLPIIDAEIARTPAEVTADQARQWNQQHYYNA